MQLVSSCVTWCSLYHLFFTLISKCIYSQESIFHHKVWWLSLGTERCFYLKAQWGCGHCCRSVVELLSSVLEAPGQSPRPNKQWRRLSPSLPLMSGITRPDVSGGKLFSGCGIRNSWPLSGECLRCCYTRLFIFYFFIELAHPWTACTVCPPPHQPRSSALC